MKCLLERVQLWHNFAKSMYASINIKNRINMADHWRENNAFIYKAAYS